MNIFLLPHQDDEYFVAPLLAETPEKSRCYFLTKGDFHGCEPSARNRESLAALEHLGVAEKSAVFLGTEQGVPDNGLARNLRRVFLRVAEDIAGMAAHAIYAPAYEGGHPDHDAASILGCALGRESNLPCYEFFAYHAHPRIPHFFEVMVPTPSRKKSCFAHESARISPRCFLLFHRYPSQWKTWIGLLPPLLLRVLRSRALFLHASRREDFSSRPHSGKLYYEYRGWAQYETFAEETKPFRETHIEGQL